MGLTIGLPVALVLGGLGAVEYRRMRRDAKAKAAAAEQQVDEQVKAEDIDLEVWAGGQLSKTTRRFYVRT